MKACMHRSRLMFREWAATAAFISIAYDVDKRLQFKATQFLSSCLRNWERPEKQSFVRKTISVWKVVRT